MKTPVSLAHILNCPAVQHGQLEKPRLTVYMAAGRCQERSWVASIGPVVGQRHSISGFMQKGENIIFHETSTFAVI